MIHPHPRALEAAYEAAAKVRLHLSGVSFNDPQVAESFRELIRAEARAAVTAYLDALQETHALVPKKPTEAMQNAAVDEMERWGYLCDEGAIKHAYRAMIDAAPPAAQGPRP
jgi:DNA repair photolyase